MAHFRRRFYDIAKGGNAPIAIEALERIGKLYEIEAGIRGRPPGARADQRQARTKPLIDDLKPWLEEQLARVSGRSPIAEAIRYGLSHWTGLLRFLDDGRIEIDSNTVERSIRPIALNRKNALFAGSDEGGANWAIIASLIETCKLNDINPQAWLADTLTKLVNGWPQARIDELNLWLEQQLDRVSGRSPLAEAIRYGLSHWDGLVRFLDDGRIEIDSNTVERSIRGIALNRKNALFAGSDEGG